MRRRAGVSRNGLEATGPVRARRIKVGCGLTDRPTLIFIRQQTQVALAVSHSGVGAARASGTTRGRASGECKRFAARFRLG